MDVEINVSGTEENVWNVNPYLYNTLYAVSIEVLVFKEDNINGGRNSVWGSKDFDFKDEEEGNVLVKIGTVSPNSGIKTGTSMSSESTFI